MIYSHDWGDPMLTRLLLVFGTSVAAFFSVSSFASTGGADVALFTPWTYIQKQAESQLNSKTITQSQTLPGADWQLSQWSPHLTNVKWNLSTKLNVESFTTQSVQIITKGMQFSVSIQTLAIDQVIEQNVDGAVLRVHVQGTCGPITMTQNAATMEAQLGFLFQGAQIATSLDMFKLNWAPGSWTVNNFTCQGPQGFDQTVHGQIAADLANPDMIRPWLQNILAGQAQAQANYLLTQLASPIVIPAQQSALPLVLTFHQLENHNEGILNYGTLVWSGKQNESNLTPLVMNGIPNAAAKSSLPMFLSPTAGWTQLVAAQLEAKSSTFDVNMNNIKSFGDLLNSPNEQSAVWPDLQNYSAKSPFTMAVNRPRSYSLTWNSDGTANVESPVNAMIESVRAGRTWNYVAITGSVDGTMKPTISRGIFNVNLKFGKSHFNDKFQPSYVQTFNPDQTMGQQVLDGMSSYVNEGFQYGVTLPTMNLGVVGKATFSGWMGLSRDLIGMPVAITP